MPEDTKAPFERISIDPTICHGQAYLRMALAGPRGHGVPRLWAVCAN